VRMPAGAEAAAGGHQREEGRSQVQWLGHLASYPSPTPAAGLDRKCVANISARGRRQEQRARRPRCTRCAALATAGRVDDTCATYYRC
jgi:hypothetical protein